MTIPIIEEAEVVAEFADCLESECEKLTRLNAEKDVEINRLRSWIEYQNRKIARLELEQRGEVEE